MVLKKKVAALLLSHMPQYHLQLPHTTVVGASTPATQ
jgi:hypothetical protein